MGKIINFQEAVEARKRNTVSPQQWRNRVAPKVIKGTPREIMRASLSVLEEMINGEDYQRYPALLEDMKIVYRITLKILESVEED